MIRKAAETPKTTALIKISFSISLKEKPIHKLVPSLALMENSFIFSPLKMPSRTDISFLSAGRFSIFIPVSFGSLLMIMVLFASLKLRTNITPGTSRDFCKTFSITRGCMGSLKVKRGPATASEIIFRICVFS